MHSKAKFSLFSFISLIVVLIVFLSCLMIFVGNNGEPLHSDVAIEKTSDVSKDSKDIKLKTYVQEDNSGYFTTNGLISSSRQHPLYKNFINLSVSTEAEYAVAKIDEGEIKTRKNSSVDGYGITGRQASVNLKFNQSTTENIYGQPVGRGSNRWSISNDSAQSIGNFQNIGVVGTGALIVQKSYDGENWTWQDKDGVTHSQLHTFSLPDTIPPSQYNGNNAYTLYTPSGEDLGRGVFLKFTYCYEVKNTDTWKEKALGFLWDVEKSETYYKNIIEEATIYMVQNSGTVLFHNASNFGELGEEDGTGAFTPNQLETIKSGDATFNGFRVDTMGVDAYTIKCKKNGVPLDDVKNGQYIFEQGRYDFSIERKIGAPIPYTVFIDRREPNDAASMYFGKKGLITEDSHRIFTTGEYPTYIANKVKWNLNATDGTLLPVVGKLYRIEGSGEDTEEVLIRNIIQPIKGNYSTDQLQGVIDKEGLYKAEFWSNPHYFNSKGEIDESNISGDLFHFTYRFEVVAEDTPKEPSVNQAYLNGLISFSDLQSKYYSITLNTAGEGNVIFAFSSYSGAYNYVYKLERSKVVKDNNNYIYKNTTYFSQNDLLIAIDLAAKDLVEERYFDATVATSYQTLDISDESVLDLALSQDVILFVNDTEQEYAKSGDLPSINSRKYRYISAKTGEVSEGLVDFKFLELAGFESSNVTLTNKSTKQEYAIEFDVSVEYQLNLANAPSGVYTVKETNEYGEFAEYDVRYIARGKFTGEIKANIFRNGKYTENTFNIDNRGTTVYAHGFRLTSATNELDEQSIVKVDYNGKTKYLTFAEVNDIWFSESGAYYFTLIDRHGNTTTFTIVIDNAVGIVNVNLNVELADSLEKNTFMVFVGEEIELPQLVIKDDRFVFEGWYNIENDILITDGKVTPTAKGNFTLWEQVKQKFTYLNFNSNGGIAVESIKAVIGEPMQLPITDNEGWAFGGWEYGGNIYKDTFVPTTATSNFTAIWNYISTDITLNNGNMVNIITARPGELVKLPFPARSGFTFLGWYETINSTTGKVYYGQITKLANITALSLDALWIRNSEVDSSKLDNGTGGKIRVHFIDGTLDATVAQGGIGSAIDAPIPTRAGYKFIGWMWRTSDINGKIFTNNQVVIPEGVSGKIIVEALWVAKSTNPQGIGAGTISSGTNVMGKLKSNPISSKGIESLALLSIALIAFAIVALMAKINKRRALKPKIEKSIHLETLELAPVVAIASAVAEENAPLTDNYTYDSNQTHRQAVTRKSFSQRVQSYKGKLPSNIGMAFVMIAILLVVVMFSVGTFGDFINSGVPQYWMAEQKNAAIKQKQEDALQAENQQKANDKTVVEDKIDSNPKNEILGNFKEQIYTKANEEIPSDTNNPVELSDDEAFLYALIMLDFFSLGYDVFPAKAVLTDKSEIYGLGYSNYAEAYNRDNSDVAYFGAGIVAFPNQKSITKEDIDKGIDIIDVSITEEEAKDIDAVYSYILTFTESYGVVQFVADGKYVTYSVKGTEIEYQTKDDDPSLYNSEYGTVYNYDDGRIVFDPDLSEKFVNTATSLNTLLDGNLAKQEYTSYITEQTKNGFTVDTMNFVFLNYSALESYLLSEQDESLLGIDVQEFYDMERSLGANQYYSVDAEGNLVKLDFPPKEEDKATWLDRLAGAILAIGSICIGVIIVATLSVISCGATSALAPYVMGAFIGAGVEIFMQTVVQGNKISEMNWLRVGIAAVSGVLAAIPGVGWFGAGLIDGVTELAMTLADGGSLQDALIAFGVGFATGIVIHGVSKGLSKLKFCFVGGTAVLMAGGYTKAIENIRVGDMVKSYDQANGKIEDKRVLSTSVNSTSEVVKVKTSNGNEIVATPGHQFYANSRWLSAEDLRAGDILVNVNGEKVIVEQVSHEILDSPVKVYNFEVADNHTYLVGDNGGMVVHNAKCSANANASKKLTSNELGKQGEEIAGKYLKANKNTKIFDAPSGSKRIPDFIVEGKIAEVKNVKSQSFTKQIKDSIGIAKEKNSVFELIIDEGTQLTKPLKQAIQDAGGIITRLKMR